MPMQTVNGPHVSEPPVISVVIPCYNAHLYLDRAIKSVRSQSYRDYEIIVVDDGSSDPETLAVLQRLPSDIRLIRQENIGLAGARNTGFREAKGRLVLPLDCDDWIDARFLEKAMDAMKGRNESRSFCFCYFTLEGDVVGTMVKECNFFEQLFANQLPYCMLVSKVLWSSAGGYDESMRYGYEDWEFNIRLLRLGASAIVVREPLFHYRVSGSGMLKTISNSRHGMLWSQIQQKHKDVYSLRVLVPLYREYRRKTSSRPLWIYFIYWGCHRILPATMFLWMFRKAMYLSHSRRLQTRAG